MTYACDLERLRVALGEKVQTVGNKLYDLAVEWVDEFRPRGKAGDEEK